MSEMQRREKLTPGALPKQYGIPERCPGIQGLSNVQGLSDISSTGWMGRTNELLYRSARVVRHSPRHLFKEQERQRRICQETDKR